MIFTTENTQLRDQAHLGPGQTRPWTLSNIQLESTTALGLMLSPQVYHFAWLSGNHDGFHCGSYLGRNSMQKKWLIQIQSTLATSPAKLSIIFLTVGMSSVHVLFDRWSSTPFVHLRYVHTERCIILISRLLGMSQERFNLLLRSSTQKNARLGATSALKLHLRWTCQHYIVALIVQN